MCCLNPGVVDKNKIAAEPLIQYCKLHGTNQFIDLPAVVFVEYKTRFYHSSKIYFCCSEIKQIYRCLCWCSTHKH